MERLINDLLALDKRGRALVEEAEARRAKISEAVRRRSEGYRDTLENRAEAHLERARAAYEQASAEKLEAAQADFSRRLAAMEQLYAEKRGEWVATLVKRSIGG